MPAGPPTKTQPERFDASLLAPGGKTAARKRPAPVPKTPQGKTARKGMPVARRTDPPLSPKDVCTVIYVDHAMIAVNKAPGCPVVPTGPYKARAVTTAVAAQGYGVTYPINLLDAEATGLVLLSRTPEAAKVMRWNWRSDLCKREFVAIAQGDIDGARGRITFPIGSVRKGNQVIHQVMATDQGGKAAATSWKLIARGRTMARLQITMTGNRTHQIRIHLAAIGYPVVGDTRYGVEMSNTPIEALVGIPAKYADAVNLPPYQIAVHLGLIRIPHPETDQLMEFRAPIPRILINLMPGAWILDGSS